MSVPSHASRTNRPRGLLGAGLLMGALIGSALLFASVGSAPAAAHQDPLGCSASGLGTVLGATPAGTVQIGDVITYTVTYANSGASACNITNLNANLVRPNGTSIAVLTAATLNVGATLNCPGDAGCAAGPYTYTVALADETGPVTGPACPPVPTGAVLPRRVTAVSQATGTLHSVVADDTAADCKSISRTVVHTPNVTTAIHNAAHQVVTAVPVGTTVHDSVSVVDPNGFGIPTGTVTFSWFDNGTCNGNVLGIDTQTLDAAGNFDDTTFAFTVSAAGLRSFRAHYNGDDNFTVADSPCEPLNVVDANIQITPATDTDEVNDIHTLTGHVNINDGTGQTNAPANTTINFAIAGGPGTLGSSSCLTVLATGSCTVTLTSATPGTTTVNATTTVSVLGASLTRTTNGINGNSGSASKTWVDANIQITPLTDTDAINDTHTLTGHVNVNPGTGQVNAPDNTTINFTIVSGPGSLGAPSCLTTGGSGECTVTLTSAATGTTVISANTTVTVGGVSLTRSTNGVAPNSATASKTWVNANIQITPASDTNEVNDIHTLTGHVNVDTGGGLGNAPDNTTINFAITGGPGTLGSSSCLTSGGTGSCTVTLTSATPGLTVVNATTTITVGGVAFTLTTNGSAGNSGPANKTWVDASISIAPNDTDPVNDIHTFTVTVLKNPGTGNVPANGEHVTFSLTDGGGAVAVLNAAASTCDDAGANTDSGGQCIIVFTSATAGTTTGNATVTITIGGATLVRDTDPATVAGHGPNGSDSAVKTWVSLGKAPFTPGYWKNHESATTALLPQTLGGYTVATFADATAVFDNMNCGSKKPNSALGCLAGHLLAAKLSVANGSSTCINSVIAQADALLVSLSYTGPSGTYTLTAAQRQLAIDLNDQLDVWLNNGGVCI